MKYRVFEKESLFYPQYFDYEEEKWNKFYNYEPPLFVVYFLTLEEAYEFLREQIPTQFIHPFPEQ